MHYFSIHNPAGEHLGFFVMLPDDENETQPQGGRFIVKLQSETPPQDKNAMRVLSEFEHLEQAFCWKIEKDKVILYDDGGVLGSIQNEHLKIRNQSLLLSDMTGLM